MRFFIGNISKPFYYIVCIFPMVVFCLSFTTLTIFSNNKMCKIFNHNLQITIEANKKVVDFLDITLDLRTAIYKLYKKPNSNLTYIHKQSNHPPSIIKNLPKSINKRLSTNSKNAQIFNEACPYIYIYIYIYIYK